MRIAVVTLVAFLAGCTSTPTADAGSDTGVCYPVVHVCVTSESGGGPAVGAMVQAMRPGDVPALGTTGADGCVDLDLPEGTWSVRADTTSLCGTPTAMVTVPACGTVEQPLMALTMLCVDGML